MVYALIIAAVAFLALLVLQSKVPLRYNWRNVAVRWRTTAMTALAFTVVIGLLTVMLGFVNGMYRLTLASGQPGNVIILSERATDEVVSNLMPADVGDLERQQGIVRENDRPLASRETYLVVNQPIPNAPAKGLRRRFLQVRGLDDPVIAARVHNLELLPGGAWFSAAGVREAPASENSPTAAQEYVEAVLGEGVASELGRDRLPEERAHARNPERLDVGDTFTLGGRTWLVTGILQSSGSTFNSEVWAKRSLVAGMFGKDTYTSLVLRTRDAGEAQRLKEFLSKDYNQASVQAEVETEYYESLSNTNQQFLFAIAFVTVVMSVGGVFGVMNTMFAAISQRTRDIGVRIALGASQGDIMKMVLGEGGWLLLTGLALGVPVFYGLNFLLQRVMPEMHLPGFWLLASTMLVLGGTTLLACFVPARRAAAINPVEALRAE